MPKLIADEDPEEGDAKKAKTGGQAPVPAPPGGIVPPQVPGAPPLPYGQPMQGMMPGTVPPQKSCA